MGVCNCSMFCSTLLYVHSSISIILMGKRELVALLNLSSWCLVIVEWLFLAVPWGCLRFVIVVFPDHTHYFFLSMMNLACSRRGHWVRPPEKPESYYRALSNTGQFPLKILKLPSQHSIFLQILWYLDKLNIVRIVSHWPSNKTFWIHTCEHI